MQVLRDLLCSAFGAGALEFGDGVEKNYAEALKWWRKAAEQGDAEAQFNLGGMYQRGEGAEKDYAEAVKALSEITVRVVGDD